MHLNFWPVLYLGSSLGSGIYAYKAAKQAIAQYIRGPLGSDDLASRIEKTTQDTLRGELSISDFIFGTDSATSRVYHMVSGTCLLLSSLVLSYLCYFFYDRSFAPLPVDLQFEVTCQQGLKDYYRSLDEADQTYQCWKSKLCAMDQKLWKEASLSFTQDCFKYVALDELSELCEDKFDQWTLQAESQEVVWRDQLTSHYKLLKKEFNKVNQICMASLSEMGKSVDEKCSYLYPYIGLDSDKVCSLVAWLPFKISQPCQKMCTFYAERSSYLHDALNRKIPKTNEVHFDCRAVLEEEAPSCPQEPEFSLPLSLEDLRALRGEIVRATYGQNWRNLTAQNTDFIYRKYQELKKADWFYSLNESLTKNAFIPKRRMTIRDMEEKVRFMQTVESLKLKLPSEQWQKLMESKNRYIR